MTTAYTSLLGLALPVTGELSGTWGDTVNTAITSLLDTAIAGTTSITVDADTTLSTTTGASNEARQAIILWNPASGTTTRNITAPAQSKLYTVINASGGTQSIVIRGAGPTTGVTIAKGESAMVAWNGSDFVKVSSSGGALTLTNLTVTGNTILGDAAADTLTVNATSTFAAPVSFQGLVNLPSTGRSAAAALTVTAPAFLYGVASTYTDTTSSGTIAAMAPFYSIARPTLATSNVTTYTNAATLYIANSPAAGGSATITNPYAMYIAAGNMYFGGSVASNLLFVDNTYDIGASGATRPRSIFLAGNATVGSLTSGRVTYAGTGGLLTDSANFQYDGTNLSVGIAPLSGVQLYVYAPVSTDAQVRIAVPTATQATYTSYVNTTVTKVGTENSSGGSLASGSSAYATIVSNNGGYPVQVGTNNVIRTTVTSGGNFGVGLTNPSAPVHAYVGTTNSTAIQLSGYSAYTAGTGPKLVFQNGTGTGEELAGIQGSFNQAANGNYGRLSLFVRTSDALGIEEKARIEHNGAFTTFPLVGGDAVFNANTVNASFRVASDNNTHMLFVDGGNNWVAIGAAQWGVSTTTFQVPNIAITDTGSAHQILIGNQDSGGTNAPSMIRGVNGALQLGWGNSWTSATGGTMTIALSVDKGSTSVVVNEDSGDIDFRVESDTHTHALYMEASVSRVGINNSSPYQALSVTGIIEAGSSSATNGSITMYNQYSGSSNDYISLWGTQFSSGGPTMAYGLASSGSTAWNSTYDNFSGTHSVLVLDGSNLRFLSDETSSATTVGSPVTVYERLVLSRTEAVFNDDSRDVDFRVESDTNTHALFVDAGNTRVGIGESNPARTLDVNGIVRVGYALNQSSPVQNTWYDVVSAMDANTSYKVSLQAIKASNEEFAMYETLYVIGGLVSNTRTSYYAVGAGAGLEYRILNNFPSANQMQVRVTTTSVSSLRASVIQMP